jgi:hypothetical protein
MQLDCDDLRSPEVVAFLSEHVAQRREVSLETGAFAFFAPARALYARHGFVECAPFGDYRPDPASTFTTLALRP